VRAEFVDAVLLLVVTVAAEPLAPAHLGTVHGTLLPRFCCWSASADAVLVCSSSGGFGGCFMAHCFAAHRHHCVYQGVVMSCAQTSWMACWCASLPRCTDASSRYRWLLDCGQAREGASWNILLRAAVLEATKVKTCNHHCCGMRVIARPKVAPEKARKT
jgi:hypothetical protein